MIAEDIWSLLGGGMAMALFAFVFAGFILLLGRLDRGIKERKRAQKEQRKQDEN